MTMPVGSGKNACYGYEDEDEGGDASLASSSESTGAPPQRGEACDATPDYTTATASVGVLVGATVSLTADRYHHVYTAGGGFVGLGAPGLGGALVNGYLRDAENPCQPPSEEKLEQFLTGGAWNFAGGAGAAYGGTISSGQVSHEYGYSTPQLSASYTVSARHPSWE